MINTGNYQKAREWILGISAIVAVQIFAIIQLSTGKWGSTSSWHWFFIFIPSLLLSLVSLIVPRVYIEREQMLQGAYRKDNKRMTQVAPPFLTGSSLARGESVTIVRTSLVSNWFLSIYILLLALPFFASVLEIPLAVNLHDLYSPNQSILTWLFLCLPALTGVTLAAILYWILAINQYYAVTADDFGITVQRSFNRKTEIPWNDIHIFVCEGRPCENNIAGRYWVAGQSHLLSLDFTEPSQNTHTGMPYRYFDDGNLLIDYTSYIQQANKILSLVILRGGVNLYIRATSK